MILFLIHYFATFSVLSLIVALLLISLLNVGMLQVPRRHKWVKKLVFRKTVLKQERVLEEFDTILNREKGTNVDAIIKTLGEQGLVDYRHFQNITHELRNKLDKLMANPIDPLINAPYK